MQGTKYPLSRTSANSAAYSFFEMNRSGRSL
jgi:hypothetical protein